MTTSELLKTISNMYEQTAHLSPEIDKDWARLFSSKDFNNILTDAIEKQWT